MQSSGSSIVMRILGQEAYLKCEIDFCFSRQCTRQFQIGLFFSLDWYLKIFLSCHSKMKSSQTISNFMWHRLCDVDFVTSTMWHRIRMISFCFNNVEVLSHWQKRLFQPGIRGPLYFFRGLRPVCSNPRSVFDTIWWTSVSFPLILDSHLARTNFCSAGQKSALVRVLNFELIQTLILCPCIPDFSDISSYFKRRYPP